MEIWSIRCGNVRSSPRWQAPCPNRQDVSFCGSGAPGDEAISGVARRAAVLDIGSLQPRNPVVVHGRKFGTQVELVEARRVVAEDRAFDCAVGRPERSKTILLAHILWDLEAAECLDLPLGRAVPH